MQLFYPTIHKEADLPLYVTGVGLGAGCTDVLPVGNRDGALLLTVKGKGTVTVGGKNYRQSPGSVCWMSKEPSFICTPLTADFTVHWVTFGGLAVASAGLFTSSPYAFIEWSDEQEPAGLFEALWQTLTSDPLYGGATASAMLYSLLIRLNRDYEKQKKSVVDRSPAMTAVLRYISEHYDEDITLDALCLAAGGLSEQYLCRLFKQTTGMRPMEYILEKRIGIACAYLEKTDMNISQVAQRTGFHNTSYFYRTFKKFAGTSPLSYRQSAGKAGKPDTKKP